MRVRWVELLVGTGARLVFRQGAAQGRLDELERQLGGGLPSDLRDLLSESNGFEDADGQWEVAWSASRVAMETLRLRSDGLLGCDDAAFGDSGAGDPFCVDGEGAVSVEERADGPDVRDPRGPDPWPAADRRWRRRDPARRPAASRAGARDLPPAAPNLPDPTARGRHGARGGASPARARLDRVDPHLPAPHRRLARRRVPACRRSHRSRPRRRAAQRFRRSTNDRRRSGSTGGLAAPRPTRPTE